MQENIEIVWQTWGKQDILFDRVALEKDPEMDDRSTTGKGN